MRCCFRVRAAQLSRPSPATPASPSRSAWCRTIPWALFRTDSTQSRPRSGSPSQAWLAANRALSKSVMRLSRRRSGEFHPRWSKAAVGAGYDRAFSFILRKARGHRPRPQSVLTNLGLSSAPLWCLLAVFARDFSFILRKARGHRPRLQSVLTNFGLSSARLWCLLAVSAWQAARLIGPLLIGCDRPWADESGISPKRFPGRSFPLPAFSGETLSARGDHSRLSACTEFRGGLHLSPGAAQRIFVGSGSPQIPPVHPYLQGMVWLRD